MPDGNPAFVRSDSLGKIRRRLARINYRFVYIGSRIVDSYSHNGRRRLFTAIPRAVAHGNRDISRKSRVGKRQREFVTVRIGVFGQQTAVDFYPSVIGYSARNGLQPHIIEGIR